MSGIGGAANVRALVLDATPLITQSYSHYQNFAEDFYTTPTVFAEIKDAQARKNLEIWKSLGTLQLVHPNEASIKAVSNFARLTGDYSVLSANDIHILALAYELECKLNKGDWRLRRKPGDVLGKQAEASGEQPKKQAQEPAPVKDESAQKKKPRRRGGKKQREKRLARGEDGSAAGATMEEQSNTPDAAATVEPVKEEKLAATLKSIEKEQPAQRPSDLQEDSEIAQDSELAGFETVGKKTTKTDTTLGEDYCDEDDDGEWITPDTLTEAIIRDSGEDTTGSQNVEATEKQRQNALSSPKNQVALASGDFAVQNVALHMNLNLMNFISGLRIKRLRNYRLRCHACFNMFPLPKNGKPKHFCPSCGGQGTLLRCAVSVDSETGKVTPHLKANFQWNNRGNKFSMASPLSKNSQKRYGSKGFVHVKHKQDPLLLREDQKEYEQMMKQEDWTRRHNEKVLNNWIGGGSADNYISPFAIDGLKHHSVRVGKGRYVNSSRKRK
ncbi:rRNA-binding endoribonuclease KNAG_0C06370 [Huiozyma naganishii CBS 8797]|uniref:20S-pre-rRNA D-site endonuclease NOB1 n=1 Tax=Huiozyma naganishii (strain ATCC MYA-139 / BCRC 22969 / CBS 8797 / KCTC 17520 / NBRC 10181 / NCYC 3082 / Yp74L-3) TaxID=1071383 RepID=J7R4F3_HUIN7|nr:hypothetical protein KNAG_0C06370 [Kazachstania naganishii CBS 8797]CCK69730.1 hypothetical protein KNAG_0C06370 [Kazachstania naganishii CBS 8797]